MEMYTTPIVAPPSGQTSNFNAPYNSRQIGTCVAFGITCFFSTTFLGFRYTQAIKIAKKVEIDIVLVTISYGLSIVYFATLVNLMKYGWGKHMWDMSFADYTQFNKGVLPNNLAYLICPSLTRIAMLSILYRINPSVIYRSIVVAIAIGVFTYTLVLCIFTGGPCNPDNIGATTCLEKVNQAQAVLNIFFDLVIVAIPIPTIHSLNLPRKQKGMVGCILALGSGVVICTIARLPYIIVIKNRQDATYTQAILGIWSIIELNLGIVCVCAVRLKPLIVAYLPQLGIFSSNPRGTGSESWGNGVRIGKSSARISYQLHSIQRGAEDINPQGRDIHVSRTYKVDVQYTAQDSGSTDEILR